MTNDEAKQILLLYRPGTVDEQDPDVVRALNFAQTNPALQLWLQEHKAFQQTIRNKIREVTVPDHLRDAILERQKIIRPAIWWRNPMALAAAAAAVILLIGVGRFWIQSGPSNVFSNFQSRMVGAALREYRMDVETNNMEVVKQMLASKGSPVDYQLTSGLANLQIAGGGSLRWRSNPVSMVCFHNGTNMLYLFVMNRSALKDPPPETAQTGEVRGLSTLSWTSGNYSYVLAGREEPGFAQKYL
jgi:hypothetical protein